MAEISITEKELFRIILILLIAILVFHLLTNLFGFLFKGSLATVLLLAVMVFIYYYFFMRND